MDTPQTHLSFLRKLQRWLVSPHLWYYVFHPTTRYVVAWLVALITMTSVFLSAWDAFFQPGRKDEGNSGHRQIDFGGQYLMGRMLVRGQGPFLYNRAHQREVLIEAYPREFEDPTPPEGQTEPEHDVENLMDWIMGQDDRHA